MTGLSGARAEAEASSAATELQHSAPAFAMMARVTGSSRSSLATPSSQSRGRFLPPSPAPPPARKSETPAARSAMNDVPYSMSAVLHSGRKSRSTALPPTSSILQQQGV